MKMHLSRSSSFRIVDEEGAVLQGSITELLDCRQTIREGAIQIGRRREAVKMVKRKETSCVQFSALARIDFSSTQTTRFERMISHAFYT